MAGGDEERGGESEGEVAGGVSGRGPTDQTATNLAGVGRAGS